MSSLVLTIKSDKSSVQMIDKLQTGVSDRYAYLQRLVKYLESALCGLENAVVDTQTSSADPVAASGTMTLTYASISNADTVAVAGVTLTCVTGSPAGAQFKKEVDGPTTATNLAALINSNATTSKYVSAVAVASVVTITCLVKHALGNLVALATSNATGIAVSAAVLANGAGGATSAVSTYSYGF